jgi:hypothetical protein
MMDRLFKDFMNKIRPNLYGAIEEHIHACMHTYITYIQIKLQQKTFVPLGVENVEIPQNLEVNYLYYRSTSSYYTYQKIKWNEDRSWQSSHIFATDWKI